MAGIDLCVFDPFLTTVTCNITDTIMTAARQPITVIPEELDQHIWSVLFLFNQISDFFDYRKL